MEVGDVKQNEPPAPSATEFSLDCDRDDGERPHVATIAGISLT
jgi:hypothetical protein